MRSITLPLSLLLMIAMGCKAPAEEPQPKEDAVNAAIKTFLVRLALEDEKDGAVVNDWTSLRDTYQAVEKHPFQHFEDLLDRLSLAELDKLTLAKAGGKDSERKEQATVPLAVVWKLLDRDRAIRLDGLSRFAFRSSIAVPKEEGLRTEVKMLLLQEQHDKLIAARKPGSTSNPPDDVLLNVKYALLARIVKGGPQATEWPKDWQTGIPLELRSRYGKAPSSVDGWFTREALREAIVAVNVDVTDEEKVSVWESRAFMEWWKARKKPEKAPQDAPPKPSGLTPEAQNDKKPGV